MKEMFESCTVQPTGALGFHQDMMNCPIQDNTVACLIPCHDGDDNKCVSFLYHTRKCVSDYINRRNKIDEFFDNPSNCGLTKVYLKSLMHVGGLYDYQGSLFESQDNLDVIAS